MVVPLFVGGVGTGVGGAGVVKPIRVPLSLGKGVAPGLPVATATLEEAEHFTVSAAQH